MGTISKPPWDLPLDPYVYLTVLLMAAPGSVQWLPDWHLATEYIKDRQLELDMFAVKLGCVRPSRDPCDTSLNAVQVLHIV